MKTQRWAFYTDGLHADICMPLDFDASEVRQHLYQVFGLEGFQVRKVRAVRKPRKGGAV